MRLSSPLSTLLLMATGIVLTSEIALANDIYIGRTAAGTAMDGLWRRSRLYVL